MQYEKQKLTYAEVEAIGNNVIRIKESFQPNDNLSAIKTALLLLDFAIGKAYNFIITADQNLVKQNCELDENGSPKIKAQILGLNGEKTPPEPLWKDDGKEKYNEAIKKLLAEEIEIDLPKFNLNDLLECKPKIGEGYQNILKYIV